MSKPALRRPLDSATFDRTDFLPFYHEGPNVLPHDLIFHRLLHLAATQNTVVVKDLHKGYEITHHQLLSDILCARNRLRQSLSEKTGQMIRNGKEVSVLIVARGYEFVVGFFAVLALGAIAVPQSPHISPGEMVHAARTAIARATICSSEYAQLARGIASNPGVDPDYCTIVLECCTPLTNLESVKLSVDRVMDQNNPCLIIFTSGSTGPPKGSAVRRYDLCLGVVIQGWRNNIGPGYVILQTLPTHHATGLIINTIPVIYGGGCIEFTDPKFDSRAVWERFRQGRITCFSAVPTIFTRLLKYWNDVLSKLPDPERNTYLQALRGIEQYHCGSASLPRHAAKQWSQLSGGSHILERYGGTEFGNPFLNSKDMPFTPGSVGIKNPGAETYLEHGDHGEVFTRSPFMFAKYINDIEGTRRSLTEDGYFKTGDIAEKLGGVYYLKGRKSVDRKSPPLRERTHTKTTRPIANQLIVIKSGGYKVSALDIERELLEHPKIQEAIVVGIDDPDLGQRIAAAVVLEEGVSYLSLAELRNDLKDRLSYYKLPTVLRIVPELTKTASLKVPKLLLKKELFDSGRADVQRMPERAKL